MASRAISSTPTRLPRRLPASCPNSTSPVSRFLFRGERPAVDWLVGDQLGAVVGWHFRHAGGAPILADFKGRLENR